MSPSDRLSSPSRLLRHRNTQELTYCRNNHNTFTNKRISVYTDMNLDTNNYFVIQISHLSKGVVFVIFLFCYPYIVQKFTSKVFVLSKNTSSIIYTNVCLNQGEK